MGNSRAAVYLERYPWEELSKRYWATAEPLFQALTRSLPSGMKAWEASVSKQSTRTRYCIAPYERWIELYGSRIGLLGGIDLDILCQKKPVRVYEIVLEHGRRYRHMAPGYALGTGNSIPDYVPVEGYLASDGPGPAPPCGRGRPPSAARESTSVLTEPPSVFV